VHHIGCENVGACLGVYLWVQQIADLLVVNLKETDRYRHPDLRIQSIDAFKHICDGSWKQPVRC